MDSALRAADPGLLGRPCAPFNAVRIPNRGRDITLTPGLVVKIVNRHDPAVGALRTARISQITPAAIVTQPDFFPPRSSMVAAQAGSNTVRLRAITVGQAEATIAEANQARRIAFAKVGRWSGVKCPGVAAVPRTVGIHPAPVSLATADRRKQVAFARAHSRRHD